MIYQVVLTALAVLNVNAQGNPQCLVRTPENQNCGQNWVFNYKNQGDDWPLLVAQNNQETNYCGGEKQSPVNLMQPIGSYGWAYGETVPKSHDNVQKTFTDLKKLTSIEWRDHSVMVEFHESDSEDNFFGSDLATKYFNSVGTQFLNSKFKFKSQSEHTINGKHTDLEMQVYFKAKQQNDTSTVNDAAVAIMFSVEHSSKEVSAESSKDIDDFFNDLLFKDQRPLIDVEQTIRYSALMNNIFDFNNRWIYEGSFTEPPCNPGVYWNVLRTVYPIDSDRLEEIKQKLAFNSNQAEPENYTYDEGSFERKDEQGENRLPTSSQKFYRRLQKINDQNIQYVGARYLGSLAAIVTGLTSTFVMWASA